MFVVVVSALLFVVVSALLFVVVSALLFVVVVVILFVCLFFVCFGGRFCCCCFVTVLRGFVLYCFLLSRGCGGRGCLFVCLLFLGGVLVLGGLEGSFPPAMCVHLGLSGQCVFACICVFCLF